jgi:drug/metabolite transporter (DMT)-like permease
MDYLLILFTACLLAVQALCFKEFNRTYMKNVASYFLFNCLYFTIVASIFLLSGISIGGYHPATIGLGIVFGATFIIAIFCYMKAMESGPFSFTILFNSFGILVPVAAGLLFWNEPVSMIQLVGLILLFATFYLGGASSSSGQQKVSLRWILFCIASFLGNGFVMTITKWHQVLLPGEEMKEFLTIAFGTAAVLSLVFFLIYFYAKKQIVFTLTKIPILSIVLITGIVTAYGNQLIVYLASRIPSVIQFPAINGGIVILSTIASTFIFKDKLTRNALAGIGLGIVALVLLSS